MDKNDLEPCFDCGGLNISRQHNPGVGTYDCKCRDCGANWVEYTEEEDDGFGEI